MDLWKIKKDIQGYKKKDIQPKKIRKLNNFNNFDNSSWFENKS